ncbi:MAG: ECF transporter S component [Clostridia bacterium]|nr:ECF transporter S component [Clostridia bacterium]
MSTPTTKRTRKLNVKAICFCAVFAAMICVCTLISVPLPIGYFNLGDIAVLLSSYLLGPVYGMISAAIGSALADIFSSYVIYAPGTAIIKALMALVAALIYKSLKKPISKPAVDFIPRVISAIVSECVMVCGYFLYESLILGYGMGAAASIPGNTLQAVCGVIGATALMTAIKATKADRLFK